MAKGKSKPSHTDQHIIPKCYIKAWSDSSILNEANNQPFKIPHIWIYNKENHECNHFPIKTNFTKEDFYTIYNEKEERDLTIEHELDRVEGKFDWIRDNKLLQNKPLTQEEFTLLCLFIATMSSRTESRINHFKQMFKPLQEKLQSMVNISEEKIQNYSKTTRNTNNENDSSDTISLEELNEVIDKPLENIMVTFVNVLLKEFVNLKMAVFYTKNPIGFITSDNPCVWYDSQAQLRAPIYQVPALKYDSIEIILPVSPSHCILLNKKIEGYIDIDTDPNSLSRINSIMYEHTEQKYISNNSKFKFKEKSIKEKLIDYHKKYDNFLSKLIGLILKY
ncbi:DUF4238 domain-containing protein [Malaciobacter molluscorum]|uniref:DUF4238 domain-containing protein n=1 Tax=Malaciobacter molluscorum TaxID=1032072 RepID=UPI0013E95BE9|nr:DUF4238 domain-containing protein [Malaciobacter molluscorum]